MPALNRAPGIVIALVSGLLLSSCARLSPFGFPESAVGHISGRIEQDDPGVYIVHLEAMEPGRARSRHAQPRQISIEEGRQQPLIALVRPDQPLRITNLDSIYHEIFTVGSNNQFRVRLASGEESGPMRLRTPGFVRGYCRLHPHESYAYLVTEADHVVYLEAGSDFEIPGVPVGEYRIGATSLFAESEQTRLLVSADQTVQLTLRLEPRAER